MNNKNLLINYLTDCIRYQDLPNYKRNPKYYEGVLSEDLGRLIPLVRDNDTYESRPSERDGNSLAEDLESFIDNIKNTLDFGDLQLDEDIDKAFFEDLEELFNILDLSKGGDN